MKKQHNQSLIGFNAIGILMACSFFLTSCTSLQQTTTAATDDLYFTPSKEAETNTKTNARNNSADAEISEEAEYQDYQNYQDDRFLRLKVANRNRWSSIDDFGYWNNPSFRVGFGMGYGGFGGLGFGGGWDPFWNNRFGWAGYYGGFGGFGFDPFWGGAFGGFGGWGGGFGGWGGWNPYFAGMWNPYGNYYLNNGIYGGIYGGIPMNVNNYDKRIPVQPNRTNLNPYMKNIGQFRRSGDVRENGNFANSNSNGNVGARSNTPNSFRSVNSNSANNNTGGNFSRSNNSNYSNSIVSLYWCIYCISFGITSNCCVSAIDVSQITSSTKYRFDKTIFFSKFNLFVHVGFNRRKFFKISFNDFCSFFTWNV